MTTTPIYASVVAQTGIVPEHSYARCSSLASFTAFDPKPVRRMSTPRVGARPATNKRKKK